MGQVTGTQETGRETQEGLDIKSGEEQLCFLYFLSVYPQSAEPGKNAAVVEGIKFTKLSTSPQAEREHNHAAACGRVFVLLSLYNYTEFCFTSTNTQEFLRKGQKHSLIFKWARLFEQPGRRAVVFADFKLLTFFVLDRITFQGCPERINVGHPMIWLNANGALRVFDFIVQCFYSCNSNKHVSSPHDDMIEALREWWSQQLLRSATELHSSFIVILFLHHYFTTLQSLLISSHWSNRFCILIRPSFLPHFPVISFIINCSAGCFAGTFPDRGAGCDYLWLQLSNSLILTGVLWADGGDVQALLAASARRWGI